MSAIIEEGNPFKTPICNDCVHRINGTLSCAAFLRIPKDIIFDRHDHKTIYPGQIGEFVFEKIKEEVETQ
jgi:hypothetical protein